jgi:uncharacterized protein YecE (DUF72 family)
MSFDRDQITASAAALARQGVFIGTSSWKYPGWLGQLYDQSRYVWHGRFSESRLERLCLIEYAEVFKTVCVDAAYYQFPKASSLSDLASQVPPDFQFAFKVTDQITLKRFTDLPRFGLRVGQANPDFLNPDRFVSEFVGPCESIRSQVGLLIFEFSRFYPSDFERGRDFVDALDLFLGRLPKGWPYGVEIRNRHFLHADYFSMLSRHQVAHIYNSWQDMPGLEDQMAMPGSRTTPDLAGARLLLRPGRKYEEAVKLFKPYDRIKDPYPEGRSAGAKLIRQTRRANGKSRAYLYVNNRFEGSALETIAGIIELAEND